LLGASPAASSALSATIFSPEKLLGPASEHKLGIAKLPLRDV